jgi:hypothetical protein
VSLSLAQDFLNVLGDYATPIIVILIVFVLLGVLRGWVSGLGSTWGMVGVAALFVLLGAFAIWATVVLLGVVLILLGVAVLALDAYSERRGHRSSRQARRA